MDKKGAQHYQVRGIQPADNAYISSIIRKTLEEFDAGHPGTVYFDKSTDDLYSLFSKTPGSAYFIALDGETIVGGGGIFPTDGLPPRTCELVKMYLLPHARGTGLGSRLIGICCQFAIEQGYDRIYLETMPELKKALKAYEKLGFHYLSQPMGNSGHFGCDLWMLKELNSSEEELPRTQD